MFQLGSHVVVDDDDYDNNCDDIAALEDGGEESQIMMVENNEMRRTTINNNPISFVDDCFDLNARIMQWTTMVKLQHRHSPTKELHNMLCMKSNYIL